MAQVAQSVFVGHLNDALAYIAAGDYNSARVSLALARVARLGMPRVTSDVGSIDFDAQFAEAESVLALAEQRGNRAHAVRQAAFRRKARSS